MYTGRCGRMARAIEECARALEAASLKAMDMVLEEKQADMRRRSQQSKKRILVTKPLKYAGFVHKNCSLHDNGQGAVLPIAEFARKNAFCCKLCMRVYKAQRYAKIGPTVRGLYSNARWQAKQRSLEFGLTLKQFKALICKPCAYGIGQRPEVRIGIDRRDNAQGYTEDNCQPCCPRHNIIKSNTFTHEEMMYIVRSCPSAVTCGNAGGRKRA